MIPLSRERIFDFLVIVSLSLLAFSYVAHLVMRPGLISGLDWPFPPVSSQWGEYLNSVRYAWTDQGLFTGEWSIYSTVGNWIVLGYLLSEIGLNPEVYSKLTLLIAIIVSGTGCYFLLRLCKLSRIAAAMGGALYMSSPVFFDWLSLSGMAGIASVYALFPLMFYLFLKSLSEIQVQNRLKYSILTAFVVIGVYPVFGIYLGFLFLSAYAVFAVIFSKSRRRTLNLVLSSLLPVFFLSLALQTFWITVAIRAGQGSNPGGYPAQNWPIASFNLMSVSRLFVSYYLGYENAISSNPVLLAVSFIIPAFSYTALLGRKSWLNIFYAIMATSLTLFLASPLSTELVRDNFLLLGIFRDKSKLSVPIALSYSALFGSAVDSVISSLNFHKLKLSSVLKGKSLPILKQRNIMVLFVVAMLVLQALYAWPFLTSFGNSDFGNVSFPSTYNEATQYVQERIGSYKVLWLPVGGTQIRIAGQSPVAWTADFYSDLSPSGLDVLSQRGASVPQFWLSNLFYPAGSTSSQNSEYIARVAGLFNIKYVVARRDVEFVNWGTTLDSSVWARTFSNFDQVLTRSGFEKEADFGNVAVYRNVFVRPRLFSVGSLAVASGGLNILSILASDSPNILNDTAITFASQLFSSSVYNVANTIILDNKSLTDLVLPFLTSSIIVDPGVYAGQSAFNSWSQLHQWNWADPLQENLEDVALIEKGAGTLSIPITITKHDNYTIWAKVLTGPQSSALNFALSGPRGLSVKFLLSTHTSGQEALRWLRLDNVSASATYDLQPGIYTLNVTSLQGRNALARIVFAPKEDFQNAMHQVNLMLSKKCVTMVEGNEIANGSSDNCVEASPVVNFQEINPSTFNVQIENATRPFFLIFLETYDQGWQLLSGQEEPLGSMHFPVFGYANAWYVKKTGSYELTIRYALQTTLDIGMMISLTTLIFCIGYIASTFLIEVHFFKRTKQREWEHTKN